MNQNLPIGYLATNGITLSPGDSLEHAVEALEQSPSGAVPVMNGRVLDGLLSHREIARGLTTDPAAPVSAVVNRAVPVAPADLPASEGLRILADLDFPALPVATPDGHYLGTVGRAELVAALFRRRRPASVGGMATPLGVYLTDGMIRGGVGDFALMLTGLFLFIGSCASTLIAMGAAHLWRRAGWGGILGADWVATAAFLVAFALWFRLSFVAGYHAAEHQTVHAIERNEPLTVERVSAMPRPHPRCGTNLVVLFSVFATLVGMLHVNDVVAGVISLVAYRFFGHWVQLHVTTRPASRRQIENGIRAGEQILDRYQNGVPPHRFWALRRVWSMGMAQVGIGYAVAYLLLVLLSLYVPFVRTLL